MITFIIATTLWIGLTAAIVETDRQTEFNHISTVCTHDYSECTTYFEEVSYED